MMFDSLTGAHTFYGICERGALEAVLRLQFSLDMNFKRGSPLEKLVYEAKPFFFGFLAMFFLHGSSGSQFLLRMSCMLLLAMAGIILYNRWHYRTQK